MSSTPGRLYGVGLGPGDPEFITRKAARLIAEADVIAYYSGTHGRSIALHGHQHHRLRLLRAVYHQLWLLQRLLHLQCRRYIVLLMIHGPVLCRPGPCLGRLPHRSAHHPLTPALGRRACALTPAPLDYSACAPHHRPTSLHHPTTPTAHRHQ